MAGLIRRNAHDITDRILSELTNCMALVDMEITYHDDDTGSITLKDDDGTAFIVRVEMIHQVNPGRDMPNV